MPPARPRRSRTGVRRTRRCDRSPPPAGTGGALIAKNSRAQTASTAGLSPGQVSRLALKWAFGFPGATALYGQAVIDGHLYVTSNAGYVYSLDADTGCVHWSFRSQAVVRSGFSVGRMSRSAERLAMFFGDIHGMVYALDATTGDLIWKVADGRPSARAHHRYAGARRRPAVRAGRVAGGARVRSGRLHLLHVPRLSHRAQRRDRRTRSGRPIPSPRCQRSSARTRRGKDMLGPAGAGIWVTPVLDLKRRALYFGTGNAFSGTPKTANAIMAVSMDTGKVLWSMQALPLDVWHNGCPQTIPGRGAGPPGRGGAPPAGRGGGGRGGIPYPPENCPDPTGPDWDFSAPAGAGHDDGRAGHPHRAAEAGAGLGDQSGHRRGAVEAGRRPGDRRRARRDAVRRRVDRAEGVLRAGQRCASGTRFDDRRRALGTRQSCVLRAARTSAGWSGPSR